MERSIKRQQLVIAIQKYAEENGYGAADMYRIVNERGGDVSETTIRRILKADAEKENFSFEVLNRVSSSLFAVNAIPIPADEMDTAEVAEREALRAVTALSDLALQEANAKIAELERKLAGAEKTIAQLLDIAAFRRQQMEVKDLQINKLLAVLEKQ